jgi:hypothetical protein
LTDYASVEIAHPAGDVLVVAREAEGFVHLAGALGLVDGGAEAALLLLEHGAADGEDRFFDGVGLRLGIVNREEELGEEAAVLLGGEGGERIGAVGSVAELLDHLAHVGTHGGKFALVLVEAAFGDEVGFARARRGKSLEKDALGVGERVGVRGDGVAAFGGSIFEFGADQSGVDAESLGGIVGKGVALDAAGHAANVGQEEVELVGFGFRVAAGKEAAGALDEVVPKLGRGAEGFSVGAGATLADVAIGIEAAFEGEDAHFKTFLRQKRDGFFGGVGAGRIGIEVDDDAGGVAAEQA